MVLLQTLKLCAGSILLCLPCCQAAPSRPHAVAARQPAPLVANSQQSITQVAGHGIPHVAPQSSAHVSSIASPAVAASRPAAREQSGIRLIANTADVEELSLDNLLAEVQARNPSLRALYSTWQAAAQRFPQEVSLDDPMFMGMLAPASASSADVETAYALQASQKFPWHGKRTLKGGKAQAEARAAYHDVGEYRLKMIETTRLAFLEYYLVRQQLALNAENLRVMKQFRDGAEAKYRNNQVTQQDLLQADVELANLEQRQIELRRMDHLYRKPESTHC